MPTKLANGQHPLADELGIDLKELPTVSLLDRFLLLEQEFVDLQLDDSETAAARRIQIKAELKTYHPHMACCGGPPTMVTLDVPASATKEPFRINGKTYFGKITVPACVARSLLAMVHRNRQVDQDRFRGQQHFDSSPIELPKPAS